MAVKVCEVQAKLSADVKKTDGRGITNHRRCD